jgi:hypothetical protein
MGITRRTFRYSPLALGLLATACQSSTAPDLGATFDDEGALSAYQEMDSILATEALAGFEALAGRTPFGVAGAPIAAVRGLASTSRSGGSREYVLSLARALQESMTGPAAAPIISDLHRGTTFVYDPEADRYVTDAERQDAPATGVRFVLYEVDLLGRPVVDEEIGYADLVDEGDESAEDVALSLTAVAHETTVLEYRITLDLQASGGTLGVHGALQDEVGRRLDFDIDLTAAKTGAQTLLDIAFELRIDARDFSIVGTLSGIENAFEEDGSIEIIARHQDDSIRLDVTGSAGQLDGSVFVNGALFATVTGDASNPTIASATGDPLTLGEWLVLRHIVDGAEDVFDFIEDLVDPVDELVLLAIIL